MSYNAKNKLRVMTLASGYDSQCLSLERIKKDFPWFDYELVAWAEFDPESKRPIDQQPAVIAHNALFPQWKDRNRGDITQINWSDVPDFDLLFASTPCFVEGTMIQTKTGFKPIEDIQPGEMVLTHKNRYCRVARVGNKLSNDIYHINAMMFDGIDCTGNHPFWVRRRYRYGHFCERRFREPEWAEARELDKNCFLGYAINAKSELPYGNSELASYFSNQDFWYLMGRYVGDGWRRIDKGSRYVLIACSDRNRATLLSCLNRLGLTYCVTKERTADRVQISSKDLNAFVVRYGYKAYGKRVDQDTIDLPVELLKSFIDGCIDSDGCFSRNEYKLSTVSKELAYGLQQCIAKVYHIHARMNKFIRTKTTVIEGRVVNQRDTYTLNWHTEKRKQDKAFYEDGYIWFPIINITKQEKEEVVYNMEVEDDHTYTANGAIVHNCQDISNAGLQKGFIEGSGSRSSIIWNVHDCVREKKPKYIIMENVSAILSKKFYPTLKLWLDELERMGYKNFAPPVFETPWKEKSKKTKAGTMNSCDYGVPQNRVRWFGVSILRTEDDPEPMFYFPKPFPLETCLADILEEDVDEKYFLSDDMLSRFCIKSVEEENVDDKPKETLPTGMNGCFSNDLEICKSCMYPNASTQCSRLYGLMEKYGKTPLGEPYP